MPADDEPQENQNAGRKPAPSTEPAADDEVALVDELGVEDLAEVIFVSRGHMFSAAGRDAPIAEIEGDAVVLHPPQMPLDESRVAEEIVPRVDAHGILLNELGEQRKIAGCKFRGHDIFVLGELKPGTFKHYAGWIDASGQLHKMFVENEPLTSDMVFRIRNKTHDGEISIFTEITSEGI